VELVYSMPTTVSVWAVPDPDVLITRPVCRVRFCPMGMKAGLFASLFQSTLPLLSITIVVPTLYAMRISCRLMRQDL
jgi:hypothetical protein